MARVLLQITKSLVFRNRNELNEMGAESTNWRGRHESASVKPCMAHSFSLPVSDF
jgi:hypothetical protein